MRQLLLYIHVGSAIALVGEILYASLWLRSSLRRGANPGVARYVVATMRLTSRGIALPAFLVNAVTGVMVAVLDDLPWTRSVWVPLAILLYTIMGTLWHGTLIPLRRRMERLLEGSEAAAVPEGYEAMARRWIRVSVPVLALFAAILVLMIWRPTV